MINIAVISVATKRREWVIHHEWPFTDVEPKVCGPANEFILSCYVHNKRYASSLSVSQRATRCAPWAVISCLAYRSFSTSHAPARTAAAAAAMVP